MNDVKNAERGRLKSAVLKDVMMWYYHGKDIPTAVLPVREILSEWYAICEEDGLKSVKAHRAASTSSSGRILSGGGGSSRGALTLSSGGGSSGSPAPHSGGEGLEGASSAEVNARQDAGHFARFGEAAHQNLGPHAGFHLPRRHVPCDVLGSNHT
jgi:hypothetical protein